MMPFRAPSSEPPPGSFPIIGPKPDTAPVPTIMMPA